MRWRWERSRPVVLPGPDSPTDSPQTVGLRRSLGALRHRDFAIFITGALLSNIGSWLQIAAVAYLVELRTGSPAAVGRVTFFSFVPVIFLSPIGGALADRFPRRRVLLVTQSVSALLAAWLWWDVRHPPAGLTSLTIIVFLGGVALAITGPSWHALFADLVPRADLAGAVGLNSAQYNLARAVGPLLAGVLLASGHADRAFGLNALSYLAVLGALLCVRVSTSSATPVSGPAIAAIRHGVEYTRRHSGLALAVLSVGVLSGLAGPFIAFLAVYAHEVYVVGPTAYGVLVALSGLGAVAGAVIVSVLSGSMSRARITTGCLVVVGSSTLLFALLDSPWFGFPLAAVVGGAFIGGAATLNSTVQLLVSDEMRGRVLSLYFIAWGGAYPVGSLVQGAIADVVGIRIVTAASGAVLLGFGLGLARSGRLASFDGHTHRTPYRMARARRLAGRPVRD